MLKSALLNPHAHISSAQHRHQRGDNTLAVAMIPTNVVRSTLDPPKMWLQKRWCDTYFYFQLTKL